MFFAYRRNRNSVQVRAHARSESFVHCVQVQKDKADLKKRLDLAELQVHSRGHGSPQVSRYPAPALRL